MFDRIPRYNRSEKKIRIDDWNRIIESSNREHWGSDLVVTDTQVMHHPDRDRRPSWIALGVTVSREGSPYYPEEGLQYSTSGYATLFPVRLADIIWGPSDGTRRDPDLSGGWRVSIPETLSPGALIYAASVSWVPVNTHVIVASINNVPWILDSFIDRAIRFELTSDFSNGVASAEPIDSNGNVLSDYTIQVYDRLGIHSGASTGFRGYAVFMRDSLRYEVVGSGSGGVRNFKLTSALTRGGYANAEFVDALGNGTGETVQVYDHPLGIFFGAIGTPGIAAYDGALNRWQVIAIGCSES